MQNGVKAIGDSLFINTTYSYNSAVERSYEYAIRNIQENGGELKDETLFIPSQQVTAPKLEISFPGVVYEKSISFLSKGDFEFKGQWQIHKEKS